MTPRDWRDLARVYDAGARSAGQYTHNTAMQQHAGVLRAQAEQCEAIAAEREAES